MLIDKSLILRILNISVLPLNVTGPWYSLRRHMHRGQGQQNVITDDLPVSLPLKAVLYWALDQKKLYGILFSYWLFFILITILPPYFSSLICLISKGISKNTTLMGKQDADTFVSFKYLKFKSFRGLCWDPIRVLKRSNSREMFHFMRQQT